MMSRPTPWDEIKRPETDYNVRRIDSASGLPMYWAKDNDGSCLFVIELGGDHSEQFRRNETTIRGVRVDLRLVDAERTQALVLTLEQHVDRDLFFGLCETLAASLQQTSDSAAALGVALLHIKRWKAFMSGKRSRVLSPEEVRGLFAELQFLRTLYRGHLPEKDAIEAWSGPEGGHQDFVFGNTAIETKALSGRERSTVRISSEDQLESLCNRLYLTIFHLSDMPDSNQALSLNGLVRRIESELTDPAAIEQVFLRLATIGYIEMREYDRPKFLMTRQQSYRITESFPRLVRSELPAGVRRVGYEIELETIESYECDSSQIWED